MKYSIKLFFTFVVFGIFLALFSVYSFSKVANEKQVLNKVEQANEFIIRKEKEISQYIKNLDNHLLALSKNKSFINYSENGLEEKNVLELFKTIQSSEPRILRVLYLNNNGNKIDTLAQSESMEILKEFDNSIVQSIKSSSINTVWHSEIDMHAHQKDAQAFFIVATNLGTGVLQLYVSLDEIISFLSSKYYSLILIDEKCNILGQFENAFSNSTYEKENLQDILHTNDYKLLEKNAKVSNKYVLKELNITNNEDKTTLLLIYPDFGNIIESQMYYVYITILISSIILAIILAYFFSKPMAVVSDKTERLNNQLDRKVEKRTKRLKESLRVIDKYVIRSVTDTTGEIIELSEAFCETSQYTKEELLGKTHALVRHPDMPSSVYEDMWETISSGKSWDGKIKNLAKDGSYYWVTAHIEPNFVDNKIVSYTAIRINITNKVKLQELNKSLKKKIKTEVDNNIKQLKLRQEEKINTAKLTSIGALAAGITHEINTPLTYIKGNFELMQYDIEDLEESPIKQSIIKDSVIIKDGLNRIANIVEAMKEVSTTSAEGLENVNIYHTILTSLTLSFNNSKQISKIYINGELFDININKDKYNFMALVQKQRIEQVWIVIINNALDELVKIDKYEDRSLHINLKAIEGKIIIDFIDNGKGINETVIEKLFDPFVSSKNRGGMGIGLNIAKKIMDDHQGILEGSNNNGKGATFHVELLSEGAKC